MVATRYSLRRPDNDPRPPPSWRVVKILLGPAAEGEKEKKGEATNTWLSLKWGIAVVARALDVWCAGDGWDAHELVREGVEP